MLKNKTKVLFKCFLFAVSYLSLRLIQFINKATKSFIILYIPHEKRMKRQNAPNGDDLNQDSLNFILQSLLYQSNRICQVAHQKSSSSLVCRDDQLRAEFIDVQTIIEQNNQKKQNYRKIIEKDRQKITIDPKSTKNTPFKPPHPTQNTLVMALSQIMSIFIVVQYLLEMVKSTPKKVTKQPKSGQDCTICMSRTANCKTVDCSHEFCFRCLSKWTRRKGTCPMCRQDVRGIIYKNRVIEPEFLKIFDEEKIVLSEQNRITPALFPQPARVTIRPYLYVIPAFHNLAYLSSLNYYHYSYGFALQ